MPVLLHYLDVVRDCFFIGLGQLGWAGGLRKMLWRVGEGWVHM